MTSTARKAHKTEIHEKLRYQIYEGGEVVKRGDLQGHSFMLIGKVRLAQAVAGINLPSDYPLDRYRVMYDDSGPNYLFSEATVVSWNNDGSEGLITAQTDEFTDVGEYLRVEGSHSNDSVTSYYHYVTTEVTVATGQSVRFFVEYTFNNLGDAAGGLNSGASQGNSICAAVLFDHNDGNFDTPIGRMMMSPFNGGYNTLWNNDIAMSVSTDTGGDQAYLLISGVQWSLGNNTALHYLKVTASAGNPSPGVRVFHTWSYSPTADETGVFRVENTLSPSDWLDMQTDIAFTFG